jgi:hypothetical protein
VLDELVEGPDVSASLADDSPLVVVGSVPLLVVGIGSIVVLLVPAGAAVVPVDASSSTHVPARPSGASSENRFSEGHSRSGKLQKPSASHVPLAPGFTHWASLAHSYATGRKHALHPSTPTRTTRHTLSAA